MTSDLQSERRSGERSRETPASVNESQRILNALFLSEIAEKHKVNCSFWT
jgi:hypothetical protein